MGYSREHTEAVRDRILQAAGRLFRRKGFDRASIDEIMAEAGLTRGGFYAHFKSKDDLFVHVVESELELATRLRAARESDEVDPVGAALARVGDYLAPDRLNRIGSACTIAANASDLGRASHAVRKSFTQSFGGLVDEFRALLAPRVADDDERALAAVCTCVGAITMAKIMTDPDLRTGLLDASRNAVLRELGHAKERAATDNQRPMDGPRARPPTPTRAGTARRTTG